MWFLKSENQIFNFLSAAKDFLIGLIFPKICLSCGANGFSLCPRCQNKIKILKIDTCIYCGKISPRGKICQNCKGKSSLTGVIVAAKYSGIIKKSIHQLKYDGNTELLQPLGKILIKKFSDSRISGQIIATSVPLHLTRKNTRGFNQSELLGKYMAKEVGVRYEELLKRIKSTESQIKFHRYERIDNLKGAFKAETKNLSGKKIILVDDVCTSGATLEACAKELRRAGAREVWGLVLAHGN
jgi:ComF family protein